MREVLGKFSGANQVTSQVPKSPQRAPLKRREPEQAFRSRGAHVSGGASTDRVCVSKKTNDATVWARVCLKTHDCPHLGSYQFRGKLLIPLKHFFLIIFPSDGVPGHWPRESQVGRSLFSDEEPKTRCQGLKPSNLVIFRWRKQPHFLISVVSSLQVASTATIPTEASRFHIKFMRSI